LGKKKLSQGLVSHLVACFELAIEGNICGSLQGACLGEHSQVLTV
jgi:hypothetical protein